MFSMMTKLTFLVRRLLPAIGLAATLFCTTSLLAQADGVPIEPAVTLPEDEDLHKRAEEFLKGGTSLSVKQVREQLRTPLSEPVELAPVRKTPLAGREVARIARKAFIRFGWFGREEEGEENFFSLGGAYALTADGVFATCYHVVDPEAIRTGCLVGIRENGELLRVTKVLARDKVLDAAIVRVDATGFEPLPLNTDVAPGDAAYCFSDPLDAYGYFSDGVVNRFYRTLPPQRRRRPIPADAPSLLRMNVGTDWAPGSSGAAVLDQCGNAIGHVAAIWSLSDDSYIEPPETDDPDEEPKAPKPTEPKEAEPKPMSGSEEKPEETEELAAGPVLITLHEAIPAGPILKLIEAMKEKEAAPKPR